MKTATTEDIKRARYGLKDGKYFVKIQVEKEGETGTIRFEGFDSKKEAQEFYRLLKTPQTWKEDN